MHATAAGPTTQQSRRAGWLLVILLPLGLVGILRGAPMIDDRWENTPAHFWLVLATAVVCLVLAFAITESARRRRDGRLLLIGLAFVVSAGFLGLHALATPGVILAGKNAGFVLATPDRPRPRRRLRRRLGGRVPPGDVAPDRAAGAAPRGDRGLRARRPGRSSRSPDVPPLHRPVTPSEVGGAARRRRRRRRRPLRLRGGAYFRVYRRARRRARIRRRVRLRAPRRGARRRRRLAEDELAV